ncbi:GTPase [uncultured Oxalicibacterium sp.]|uniref:GTPase n=1 Tax=uncultured Oxalicibacterium sp. TaxID=1168540 RepID=UPI0025EF6D74|nr:GTPase [uncultured Oxalicibacterium sp.]
MIPVTIVTGGRAADREAAIQARLDPALVTAVIIEGLPDGTTRLDVQSSTQPPHLQLQRIAPGCLCCTGNLVMRVTLNRLLRSKPAQLFIAISNASHLPQLRAALGSPPYDTWLRLHEDMVLP